MIPRIPISTHLGKRILSQQDVLSALFDPADVSSREYQVLYELLKPEIEEAESAEEALELAISICDEFMCWAETAKEQLLRLRP
jgi:hypothetical protein